jgi:hypothetical protein
LANTPTVSSSRKIVKFIQLVLGVLGLCGILFVVGNLLGVFTNSAPIPVYPNGRTAELTLKGNQFIDSLYEGSKREASTIKTFLTKDSPEQVVKFYTDQFSQQGFQLSPTTINDPAIDGATVLSFSKKDGGYVFISSTGADGLVKDQSPGESYTIILEGSFK